MLLKRLLLRISKYFPIFDRYRYLNGSFAQEGEDLIVLELLNYKKDGFFVDVGAHHPFRFSNTQLLKNHGWTGINIEPNPRLYHKFSEVRKDDINLNCGVSASSDTELIYYQFDEAALNTFSKEISEVRLAEGYKLLGQTLIQVKSLEQILKTHAQDRYIDLLSVDVEGLDFEVLKTNNWELFNPKCVLIEDHQFQFGKSSEIESYLRSRGYELVARTLRNSIFIHRQPDSRK